MPIYIYALRCPLTDAIRYIGKSADPKRRRHGHMTSAARLVYNHHTARWLRKILAADLLPEIVVLEEIADGARWQEAERRWIAYAREQGWPLTNSTAGGEGLDYIDPEADAAYRNNLSRAMKELWNRPERREEARQRTLKALANPEINQRRIKSISEAFKRPDVKARLAAAMAEVFSRPEVRTAKSAATKALWQTEEYRAVLAAARNDPKFVAEQAERLAQRWKDPAHRQKMRDARWSEEKRAEQAQRVLNPERQAKIKAAMTPEVIARRNASIKASWDRRKAAKAQVDKES